MIPFVKKYWWLLGILAVGGYFVYRYYENNGGSLSPTGALGTNLNSIAPELVGGSAGPSSGLDYYAGSTTINISEPSNSSAVPPSTTVTPPRVVPHPTIKWQSPITHVG